ncbi:hypothetical protein BLSTO_05987 [Blastocystis sp. subtype 1]
MSGDETFSGRVSFILNTKERLVDAGGSYYSYPEKTGSQGTDKLFDNSLYTKWLFERNENDPNPWVVWSFGDRHWELMNQYELATANDVPERDCRSWKIYGSMDEIEWVLLDERVDVTWTGRFERKEFTMYNYVAYRAYKWECTRINPPMAYSPAMQMSEWNLLLTDQPFITRPTTLPPTTLPPTTLPPATLPPTTLPPTTLPPTTLPPTTLPPTTLPPTTLPPTTLPPTTLPPTILCPATIPPLRRQSDRFRSVHMH